MSNQGSQGSNSENVTVNVAGTPTIIVRNQPGCLVQLLYFVFIGWWLGALAISLAYLLFLTILGIPLGVMIINKIPYLMALRQTDPVISYAGSAAAQHNFIIRALWFLLIGILANCPLAFSSVYFCLYDYRNANRLLDV